MDKQFKDFIIFTCSKCLFSTKDTKLIEIHVKKCDSKMSFCHEQIGCMRKQISELEENIIFLKEKENKFYTQIRLERFKNKIYRHLIESNTKIKVSDVLTEEEDGIHVWTGVGIIPIHVHELSRGEEVLIIKEKSAHKLPIIQKKQITKRSRGKDKNNDLPETSDDPSKNRKQSYRSIKTCLSLVTEPSENEIQIKISSVDSKNQKKLDEFGDLNYVTKNFEEYFVILKQSRIYTKILNDLANRRMSIFGRMNLSSYQNLIADQIRKIEDIFREKNYTDKKSTIIISKGLSPLESRLVSYGTYTQTHLEIDEIQKFNIILDLEKFSPKEYVPYDSLKFFNCFYNYGIVVFSMKKTLERYLFNQYDLCNVIYLPLPKNTTDDPYSFYVLDRVIKEKRYWKMDCRMEDLSASIISNVLPYMIGMFRKLYRDVFSDNDFRKNFGQKCQMTECDCEQLLQNIILLGQPKEFYNVVRILVKSKATYMPTENDKFNLYGDDSLQRKRFHDKEEVDLVDIIKQLFDDITSEQAVDFYRIRTNLK